MSQSTSPHAQVSLTELKALQGKYHEMLWLRASRSQQQASGQSRFEGDEALLRRERFRKLAREFPGALREMELDASILRKRHDAVAALDTENEAPPWLLAVALYHRFLRQELKQRKQSPPEQRQKHPSPSLGAWEQVASTLNISWQGAEALVFPNTTRALAPVPSQAPSQL